MNRIQTFNFNNQTVRTVQLHNEPFFNLKDVCEILEIGNPSQLKTRLKQDGVITNEVIDSLGRTQQANFISESNLYKVIFQSRKEEAEQFTEWVTAEVLPAIRKNGVYLTDEKAYDITHNPQSLADLLLQAGEQLKQKELIIKDLKPKTLFADAVSASHTSILVGDLAKLINQNGYNIGQNRLFDWLRENDYLIKGGSRKNMPTQKSMEMELFEIKETTIQNPDGSIRITRTPKVTGKGQVYFINKFLGN